MAFLRVGGGVGLVGGGIAPVGRVVLDVLPLWFLTLSIDVEYWIFSASSQQLLPFIALTMPLIFHTTVGAAPILSLSAKGVGLVQDTLALKGGLGVFVGPLGLFSEALFLVSASEAFVNGTFFAFGITVGF